MLADLAKARLGSSLRYRRRANCDLYRLFHHTMARHLQGEDIRAMARRTLSRGINDLVGSSS